VLKWAKAQGCAWDVSTCQAAAAHGHEELLEWAYTQNAPLDTHCATLAFWGGHARTFAWLTGREGWQYEHSTTTNSWTLGSLGVGKVRWWDAFWVIFDSKEGWGSYTIMAFQLFDHHGRRASLIR